MSVVHDSAAPAAHSVTALDKQGTHGELVARGGLYHDLYRQQFQGGLLECECEDGVVMADGQIVYSGDSSLARAI